MLPNMKLSSDVTTLARAYKCANKLSEFEHYKKLALDALALESDAEDAKYIEGQISELG